MAQAILKGARLAYVVQPIEGTVKRPQMQWDKKQRSFQPVMVEEPAGFLVYFPRGHVIRIKDLKTLTHYGLNKQPRIMEMKGLEDPRSPIGRLFLAQEKEDRVSAMNELEDQVIRLAEANAGPVKVIYNPERPDERPKSGQVTGRDNQPPAD
jgi:hypothetical protein